MSQSVTLLLIFIQFIDVSPNHDYFSATSEMARLYKFEEEFIKNLQSYKATLNSQECSQSISRLRNLSREFPQSGDQLEGGLSGLFLLQDFFNLNTSLFAGGTVHSQMLSDKSFHSHSVLTYEDVDFIAKTAYNREYYNRAVDWFREAVAVAVKTKAKQVITAAKNLLRTTIKVHDKVLDQKGPQGSAGGNEKAWKTNPVPFDEKLRKKKKFKQLAKEAAASKKVQFQYVHAVDSPKITNQFSRLCRGEILLTPNATKDVFCHYLHHHDPYLRLRPYKMDDQSLQPYITVFRDFFTEREMSHYKDFARDKLVRSTYGGTTGAEEKTKKPTSGILRTSKQTWLYEYDETVLFNISRVRSSIGHYMREEDIRDEEDGVDRIAMGVSRRISRATRLHLLPSGGGEHYQVANYGLGGFYNHHPDPHMWHHPEKHEAMDEFTKGQEVMTGDRVATFMGYLSNTELGGATAFPNAGLAVEAEAGSAVFWWNLFTNGLLNPQTLHGGCPVVVGSKWITNKWVGWKHQQLKMPCTRARKGWDRQPPLDNTLCRGEAGRQRCNLDNNVLYRSQEYYAHLKQFSPEF